MSLVDKLNDRINRAADVLYTPLDRAGDLATKVTGRVVEKTGVSKYTYAETCNIAGAITGAAATFDAYSSGMGWVGVISALFTGYHIRGAVHNYHSRKMEGSGMSDDVKECVKSAESQNVRHAAGLVAMGLGLGAAFGIGYFAGDMRDPDFLDSLRVLSSFSATVLFGGLEGLFKGAKTSK